MGEKLKMIFTETPFKGLYKIDLEKRGDDRGFFARVFCKNEYEKLGLNPNLVQMNTSVTPNKGTFRGMHYQVAPKAEDKIIKVTRGSLYDISLDLRPDSATFGKYFSIELNADNRTMMYIPKGFAHGYLILEDNTELIYMVTEFYSPESEHVIRWNDPKFNIELPYEPTILSEKDKSAPDFSEETHLQGISHL